MNWQETKRKGKMEEQRDKTGTRLKDRLETRHKGTNLEAVKVGLEDKRHEQR
jgi:hypothetical protein